MSRVRARVVAKNRHKKIFKLAKGYRGRAKNCFTVAVQKVEKALQYSYRDRRNRKRDFRKLWIQRINAATRIHGFVYSKFINGLHKCGIIIDRKMLSELAVNNTEAFQNLVAQVKSYEDAV